MFRNLLGYARDFLEGLWVRCSPKFWEEFHSPNLEATNSMFRIIWDVSTYSGRTMNIGAWCEVDATIYAPSLLNRATHPVESQVLNALAAHDEDKSQHPALQDFLSSTRVVVRKPKALLRR